MAKKYNKREKSQTFFGTVNDDEEHVISIFFSQNSICFNYTSTPVLASPAQKNSPNVSKRSASVPNASSIVQEAEPVPEKRGMKY